MPDQVSIDKGLRENLPEDHVAGRILITTDQGDMYVDYDNQHRVQIKDATKLPLTGGTMLGPISMSNQRLSGLPAPSAPSDAARLQDIPKEMSGATSSNAGTSGTVPAPSAGASNRYLRSDGSWAVPTDTNTTYSAGTGLTLNGTTFNHANNATAGSAGPSANDSVDYGDTISIPQVTINAQGHVTTLTNRQITLPSAQDVPTYTAGTGITISDNTISHATVGTAGTVGPTSNQSPTHGGTFVVPSITTDARGHVSSKADRTITLPTYSEMTGASTSEAGSSGLVPAPSQGAANRYLRSDGTWTVPTDTNTTYSAGTALSLSGTTFNHQNYGTAGSAGPEDDDAPGYGGTITVPAVTVNAQGHVTSLEDRTITLPSAQSIPTYTGGTAITVSGTTINHNSIGSAGTVGPTGNSTATHGGTITIPSITTDAQGHVSAKADRTITLPNVATMTGASSSQAGTSGYVPAPSAGASNRYLRSDGTWQVPPDTNTTYSTFTGASSSAAGTSGLVPAPSQGASTRYLRSDGTWATPTDTNTTYTAGTGLSLSGTTFSLATSGVRSGSYGPSSNVTGNNNTTVNIPQITVDSYGRVTSITNRVYTSVNTDTNTTYSNFTGADSDSAGTSGLVPGPSAGASNRYLRSDGTWAVPTDTNTTYTAGTALSMSGTTINHQNYGSATTAGPTGNSSPGYGGTIAVPQITTNAQGHVTTLTSRTITLPSAVTLSSLGITATATELNYMDGVTSSVQTQLNSKAANSDFDGATSSDAGTHGLVPAPAAGASNRYLRSDGTWAVPTDTNTTYSAGTGLSLSGTTFNHASYGTAGTYGPSANASPAHGGTFTVPSVTTNAQGHVTGAANRTITLPTYSNMRGATSSAAGAAGLVPAPSSGYNTRFLRGDGTWQVPANTTYSVFTGSSSSAGGSSGLVPAPSAGASTRYLRCDGTWATPTDTNTTYSAGTGLSLSSTTFSLATSGVTAGSYGPTANVTGTNGTTINVPQITVDAYGRVTSVTNRVYTSRDTDTNTTYTVFTGSSSSTTGKSGLVPAPSSGSSTRYLRCDGTWAVPPDTNTTYTSGSGISISGTTINHASSITAGNVGPSTNATPSFGNTFNVPYIQYNSTGHVTSVANRTVKIPSIPNNVLTTSQILTSLSGVSSNSYVLGAKVVADAINTINTNLDNYLPLSGGTCTGKVTVPTLGITSNASISWNSSKSAIQISF